MSKVYPDRLFFLFRRIKSRRVDEWIMQMNIAAYPYMDETRQNQFRTKLYAMQEEGAGVQNNTLDRAKLRDLKRRISGEKRSKIGV